MPGLELFHRLAEPESAAARTLVRDLGLLEAVAFRNVAFDSHRDALAALGGGATPSLWDGARLHEGLGAIRAALAAAASAPSPAAPALAPAPATLLDPRGAPRLGAFAGAIPEIDLAAAGGRGLAGALRRVARAKRWIYALAVSDEVLAAVAVVEAGWFGGGFAYAVDRRAGAVLHEASAAALPGVQARVNRRSASGATGHLATGGLRIEVTCDGPRWTISAVAGVAFAIDAVLERAPGAVPFALVTRVPGGGVRATHKIAALAASGRVRAGEGTFSLEGGSGGVDVTAGLLARETAWRWAFGTGRAGGAPFGFNLCEGFGVPPREPGENAAFAVAPYRLPPVTFLVGGEASPWRISSASGDVDLVFRPEGAHREARSLGLVTTRFTQIAGVFEGRLPGPGGGALAVAGLPGVVEDHWARW
jgi:hypothetical protein